jgi:hypothetical protein
MMFVPWYHLVGAHVVSSIKLVSNDYIDISGAAGSVENDGILVSSMKIGDEVFHFSKTKFHCMRPRLVADNPSGIGRVLYISYYLDQGGYKCILKLSVEK